MSKAWWSDINTKVWTWNRVTHSRRSLKPLSDSRTTYPRLGPLGTKNGATTPTSAHNVVKQIIGRASEWDAMTPVRENPHKTKNECRLSRRMQSASMAAQRNGRFRSVPAHVDKRDMWLAQCTERTVCDWFSCVSIRIKARGLDGRQRQQTADQRDLYIYLFSVTIIAQGFNSWSNHCIIRILFHFIFILFFS